ncbi:MAG: N-6 DNA methylase [Bacteroidales bacterium]|nr:N-6 DNA methylase [Bacteroidales bacterium]
MRKTKKIEADTDDIVRDFFMNYEEDVIVERQKSSNPIIDKLLNNASKRGTGKGYPDLIIQYKHDKNFIIVIENKPDKIYHESENHNLYDKYAVDGALLYASYLSKSFDVLAIAISGVEKDDLKVSHYLHLKDEPRPFQYFGDKLLSPNNYYSGLTKSEEKKRQDYDKLLDYTRILNTKLHQMNIDEAERCILASCILLALRLPHFKTYYKTEDNQKILASHMINDVMDWFKKKKISDDKYKAISSKYATIEGMFAKESDHNSLRDLIEDMDTNIDAFEKTNRYYDVLGQLYVAFLRYANTSNDLGVVLTPTHITEFFTEVAGINMNSVVFDNCTGTCGFLIAAMSKMIIDAQGDDDAIKSIQKNQLIGIERNDKMYCLAASNMAIHGDGQTHIYLDSGLNSKLIAEIKRGVKDKETGNVFKPTVGFLNPPYKSDKKKDIEELEFVKWNLEALVEGGTCVAIVPMQCAIAGSRNKKTYALKKDLLEQHTLEAVFSMPDELFYNSDKSVVTCVMVFTAHKKHQDDKDTFFGYFKDDGFEKRKKLGRIDAHGKWHSIMQEWLKLYRNNTNVSGISVSKHVSAKDEWCAEAYMETNYKSLTKQMFMASVRNYINYKIFFNKNTNDIIYAPVQTTLLELNTEKWKTFVLSDKKNEKCLFKIKGSKTTPVSELELCGEGDYPYVTTQATTNGVKCFYDYHSEEGSCFTIDSAVKGYCSWHEEPFSASDHVEKLLPQFKCNNYIAMFLVTIINLEQYRYNYGLKCNQTRIKNIKIKLPIDPDGNPDWQFMENYIKSLPYSKNL